MATAVTAKANVDYNVQTGMDMEAARCNAKLNVTAVRALLHGGESAWKAREQVVAILSADPAFDRSQRHYGTRKETFQRLQIMQSRLEELREAHNWSKKEMLSVVKALDEAMPVNVHDDVFTPVIMAQGSDELKAKFRPLVKNRGILGCYLQTELGHGSNIAQLETTATYIPECDEFEIHSPTLTSMKWWAGALGKTANFGVVQAQLILPGNKNKGPHLFLAQLRSLDTHELLPNVKIGDIGPKAMGGFATMDNGYAQFNHLRIPRSQMLSKFAQVTREGKYVEPSHPKLSYGSMLKVRSGMVRTAAVALARAATISIRYATVRRQGNRGEDGLERQIINYPSVHCRLLPILSRAYAYTHLSYDVEMSYAKLSRELDKGGTSILSDIHATTAAFKVLVTTTTISDIEVARRSMGGHGYSAYADLGRVYANYLPGPTFEGDNFVLDQQIVRAAMKAYNQSRSIPYSEFSAYIRLLHGGEIDASGTVLGAPDWTNSQVIIRALEWRAARAVQLHAISQESDTIDARSYQRTSRAVSEAYVSTQVGGIIRSLGLGHAGIGKESESILTSLFHLYLVSTAEAALVDLLSLNIISAKGLGGKKTSAEMLRLELSRCCAQLVPEAISLTDSFGYSDWELDSALGVYSGQVYDELWRRAQTEPINQTDVIDGYKDFIKPLFERGRERALQKITSKL